MNGKIIVVTHKDYEIPKDKMYMPICVGNGINALKDKFQPDNTGDNISGKNATYCELTAIYWAWKNLNLQDLDYVGIAHYRRHFSLKKRERDVRNAITSNEIEQLVEKYGKDAVFTTPCRRYFNSIAKHYITSKKGYERIHGQDIECLKEAIRICYPEYEKDLECVLSGKKAHMLNMFIMNSNNFEKYCEWLFSIVDKVVELNKTRNDQRRYAGALSEFLLDVWLKHNTYSFVELELLECEKMGILKKIFSVLQRMLFER